MPGQRITPHLWFDTEAVEAAQFYSTAFPDSDVTMISRLRDTPSGDCDIVGFRIMGHEFMAISAGPLFKINPSISFHVKCGTTDEVDAIWASLTPGGAVLMELGEYPFSKRFGWVEDRYGVSWQVICVEGDLSGRITPVLMFANEVCGRAEEAAHFYASVFPDPAPPKLDIYAEGEAPDADGLVKYGQVMLQGQEIGVMDSAYPHAFGFNEAISFMVNCTDQSEIDRYWEALSAVPEAEQCGWIKDKFGVSWQIVPENMAELMAKNPDKTTPVMLGMKKIIIADLVKAGADT